MAAVITPGMELKQPVTAVREPTPEERKISPFQERGRTGLNAWGGYIREEFLRELQGPKGMRTYREMVDNDAVVHALVFAMVALAQGLEWHVNPHDDAPEESQKQADLISHMLFDDMMTPWREQLGEIMSMVVYGFAPFEIVYKRREGPDGKVHSTSDDGLIGWRKWAIRSPESILRWHLDEVGHIQGFWQQPPHVMGEIYHPIEKCLLFRTSSFKNNPEGRSLLRSAYRAYYFKRRIEELEGIGMERDLAGLPVLTPPEASSATLWDTKSVQGVQDRAAAEKLVQNIVRGEQEGVLLPAGWTLELLSSAGARQFNTTEIIKRWDERIAMSVLADFILVGHEAVGSYAMVTSKVHVFTEALGGILSRVVEIINRVAIPRLAKLNGWDLEFLPQLTHSNVAPEDPTAIGTFIQALSSAGVPLFPNRALTEYLFKVGKFPTDDLDEALDAAEENRVLAQEQMAGDVEATAIGAKATEMGAKAKEVGAKAGAKLADVKAKATALQGGRQGGDDGKSASGKPGVKKILRENSPLPGSPLAAVIDALGIPEPEPGPAPRPDVGSALFRKLKQRILAAEIAPEPEPEPVLVAKTEPSPLFWKLKARIADEDPHA